MLGSMPGGDDRDFLPGFIRIFGGIHPGELLREEMGIGLFQWCGFERHRPFFTIDDDDHIFLCFSLDLQGIKPSEFQIWTEETTNVTITKDIGGGRDT